jgi:hypothetical protein
MKHTPYGYEIVDGKAVIDEEKADAIRKICENYLSGMSFVAAAADVGIDMKHCGVKHMLQNKRYLGDSFYPAIITQETALKIEEERLRRAKALGRDNKECQIDKKPIIYTKFSLQRVPEKYKNPVKQAEFAYSLIQSEVDG